MATATVVTPPPVEDQITLTMSLDEANILRAALGCFRANSPTSPLYAPVHEALVEAGANHFGYYVSFDVPEVPMVRGSGHDGSSAL